MRCADSRSVERGGCDCESGCYGAGVEAPVPSGHRQVCDAKVRERLRGGAAFSAAESMISCQEAGISFDGWRQFDRTNRGPEVLPVGHRSRGLGPPGEVVVASAAAASAAQTSG